MTSSNNMREEWRCLYDYDGTYEVSNYGNVRSNSRKKRGKALKPTISERGYYTVTLLNGDKRRLYFIHSLVLTHFVGPRSNGEQADHKDADKTNNHVSNLQWLSQSENRKKQTTQGGDSYGESNGQAKLCDDAVREILETKKISKARNWGAARLARKFGVHQATIYRVVSGANWKKSSGRSEIIK